MIYPAKEYKQALGNVVLTENQRAAAHTWLAEREATGKAEQQRRRAFWADKLKRSMADAVNACQLAEAIASAVQTGRMNPTEAMGQLRQLGSVVDDSEKALPEVQGQIEMVNEADPLDIADELLERFPAFGDRMQPPPPLPLAAE